jgi:hypothetical protein
MAYTTSLALSDYDPRKDPYGVGLPADVVMDDAVAFDQGSYGLGLVVGFLTGLIGLLLVSVLGKQDTKRGALHGFVAIASINLALLLLT